MHSIQEPQHRISSHAVKVLRLNALIEMLISFVIVSVLLFLYYHYNWFRWIGLIIYILTILAVVRTVYEIFINPVYTQRTWRYEIDEKHVQLKHGAFKKTYQIIPMAKVQYVETHQGPLLRRYGLSEIVIGTMASIHTIPAIPEAEAETLRTRIAFLAEITEVDD